MTIVEKLSRWTLSYWIVKNIVVVRFFDAYFRKVEEVNKKNIPHKQPLIVAPNHQNALMDPMAFAVHLPGTNVFLTRADVFNKPATIKFLTWAKMLPIYRIRDGIESLKKNEEVFDVCVELLKLQKSVVMFPEGNHGAKRMLRQLVKGVFRISLKAQSEFGNKPGVKIIPAGVDYSDYQKFRQTLLIIYGKPIEVSDFWDIHEINPVEATNALREKLAEEMKKLVIHIETDDYYAVYMGLRNIYNKIMRKKLGIKGRSLYAKFRADKKMIQKLDETLSSAPQKIEELSNNYKIYSQIRDKFNLRDWVFSKKRYSVFINLLNLLLCVAVSPMFLLGIINNWPQFFLPPRFTKSVKDPQFVSTMKWAVGSGLLIIYYLIVAILIILFLPEWWLKIIYLVLMPVSGILALTIRKIFIKSRARLKFTLFHSRNNELSDAVNAHSKIIDLMNTITEYSGTI